MNPLANRRIAFLVADEGVEQVELTEPWQAIESAGGTPVLLSPGGGEVQAFNHLDKADVFQATMPVGDARAEDFAGLVLPGGVANPDQLRMHGAAVDFVRACFDAGRPVAVICHGPWTIAEADRVRDRVLTSWPSLQTDLRNAGASWRDEEVAICDNGPNVMVSSRKPDDLPAFTKAMVEVFANATSSGSAGRRSA